MGDETFSKYVEGLRVPDWLLLYFKTKARISENMWQAVINITKLGRTGVRFCSYSSCLCVWWQGGERGVGVEGLQVAACSGKVSFSEGENFFHTTPY